MGGRHLHLGEDLVRIDSDQDPLSPKAQAFLLSAVLGEEMKPFTKWTLPCEELHCPQRMHPASLTAFAKTQKRGKWLESKALKRAFCLSGWTQARLCVSGVLHLSQSHYGSFRRSRLISLSLQLTGVWLIGQLLCRPSSIPHWRECRSRKMTQGPARFPPTQTSAQDKVRQGCATGQQHNKFPSGLLPAHCSVAGVVLSTIKGRKSPVLSGWGRRMLS